VTGVKLFASKLRRHPAAAARDLARDYVLFSCALPFTLAMMALRRPVAWAERATARPVREKLLDAVARLSGA
jgi:hypothetical protein